MPFTEARTQLTATRQDQLDSLLGVWDDAGDIYALAATKLRADHGSKTEHFAGYLSALADNHIQLGVSPTGPRIVFEQVGQSFALAGYHAAPFKDAIFGRAILLEKYARYLAPKLDALGCFDTDEDIRNGLRAIADTMEAVSPRRFRAYFEAMKRTPLGRGAVFATFAKPVNVDERPWIAPIPDAYAVRSTIALGEDPYGKDYILFAYRLPADALPRVPTTASPGWSYQRWFRPNEKAETDLHGWTSPIEPGVPRPEIVHSEIDGSTLQFPIHIANA